MVTGLVLLGTTGVAGAEEAEHRTVFAFTDRAITESSGLVDRGTLMLTVNDSGDGPVIYGVDKASGDTVAVTTYSSDAVSDVEALAPGLRGVVWVGDIGDNDRARSTIEVFRVPDLDGSTGTPPSPANREVDAARFSLVYPDSAHDAESLLVHPDTGRLYVVSKQLTGGTVYAAPARLDPRSPNRLEQIGEVRAVATDGSFLPDGRHIIVRSYAGASVYSFPELRERGDVELPAQEQGEGLAVGEHGGIFVSSEGAYSEVLRVLLPLALSRATGDPAPQTSLPSDPASPPGTGSAGDLSTDDRTGLWLAAGVLVLTFGGWLLLTASRRRGRRGG